MRFNVSKNNREKYSEIEVSWWEVENFTSSAFMWWLPDAQSISVGGEELRIPINTADDGDEKIFYNFISPLRIEHNTNRFPVEGSQSGSKVSMVCIWGEEDNMSITNSEFTAAGGSVVLDFDPTTGNHEVVITPPQMEIGTNDNFSLTLEGSVPAVVIAGNGTKFHKRVQKVRTLHFGKVHSTLEVELPYVTNKDMLYTVIQKLLEKYSTDSLQYNLEYRDAEIPQLDNSRIVPQSVSVSGDGLFSSGDGFQFVPLGGQTEKTLGEISDPDMPLGIYQNYIKAFIN